MEASSATTLPALESFSPIDGKRLGSVPTIAPGEVQSVVDDVAEVQPYWAALEPTERGRYMRRAAQVIIDSLDELTMLLTREQGKPRNESYTMELLPTIDALHWIASTGPKILADERVPLPIFVKQKSAEVHLRAARRGGRHRAVELPVVDPVRRGGHRAHVRQRRGAQAGVAHAPDRPARSRTCSSAPGCPRGWCAPCMAAAPWARRWWSRAPRRSSSPGRSRSGRRVGIACAERMKGSVLELGGKDPMLVLSDANLPNAVSGALWGGFANAGQTCSGIERVYVMRDVAERFTEESGRRARRRFAWATRSTRTPRSGRWSRASSSSWCASWWTTPWRRAPSSAAAGRCEPGGPEGPDFFAPAVLTGVTHDMRIMREEIFGPVVPVVTVDSEDEAIALANDSEFGLGASVWTLDRARGDRIARRLEAGMVWMNDHMYSHGACACSWGGVKDSGLGRSHSKFGFYECVNVKLLAWEPSRTRNFWWHPYDAVARAGRCRRPRGSCTGATRSGSARSDGAHPSLAKLGRKALAGRVQALRRSVPCSAAEVAQARWYHGMELPGGIVTPGDYDLPDTARRIPLPESLAGKRCLDIGTRDGFWAFEMERRGAAEVVGIDVEDPDLLDFPLPRPRRSRATARTTSTGATSPSTWPTARSGSKVERRLISVYDVTPGGVGQFDFAFIGTILLHLRNPVDALAAVRRVLRPDGRLMSNDGISVPLTLLRWRRAGSRGRDGGRAGRSGTCRTWRPAGGWSRPPGSRSRRRGRALPDALRRRLAAPERGRHAEAAGDDAPARWCCAGALRTAG